MKSKEWNEELDFWIRNLKDGFAGFVKDSHEEGLSYPYATVYEFLNACMQIYMELCEDNDQ
jgi:hypothetical protein